MTKMNDFYNAFYSAVEHSQAHHVFCERVFGKDLCQHGFADLEQLELLRQATQLGVGQRAFDLGCGNGMIAEYLSDRTGALFTGLDLNSIAIAQAQRRTAVKADRLAFRVGDMNQLDLTGSAFDVEFSIDTIYFSEDYTATIRALKNGLVSSGQIAILYSYGREPHVPKAEFPIEKLPPDKTPLAEALLANGLVFRTWDLTRQDYALAQRRREVLAELRPRFEDEGAMFIFKNRMGEVEGICQGIEDGLHARYLYHIQCATQDR
jgi:SAM-dependent methyltransferase